MKKIYSLMLTFMIVAAAMAQTSQHEKAAIKNDLDYERIKRHEVARDLIRGEPGRARADNRAAVAYHRRAIAHAQQANRREVVVARHHPYVRHHYRHHRYYRRHHTTVVVYH